jgi:hypothetical protein
MVGVKLLTVVGNFVLPPLSITVFRPHQIKGKVVGASVWQVVSMLNHSVFISAHLLHFSGFALFVFVVPANSVVWSASSPTPRHMARLFCACWWSAAGGPWVHRQLAARDRGKATESHALVVRRNATASVQSPTCHWLSTSVWAAPCTSHLWP